MSVSFSMIRRVRAKPNAGALCYVFHSAVACADDEKQGLQSREELLLLLGTAPQQEQTIDLSLAAVTEPDSNAAALYGTGT